MLDETAKSFYASLDWILTATQTKKLNDEWRAIDNDAIFNEIFKRER